MEHFVTIDAGVTDADFRGVVQALVVNHHPDKSFTVRTEDRIAEVVFMKKFHANFVKVFDESLLGMVGFGSAGFGVIKKLKKDPESELTTSELTTSESDQKQLLRIHANCLQFVINQVIIYKLVLKKQ